MAGGRKASGGTAAAAAMAVALLALLVAAGEAGMCNVDQGTVVSQCMPACTGGGAGGAPSQACCAALANADFGCLCRTYWGRLKNTKYGSCAMAIPTECGIPGAPRSC
ncbi:protein LIM1-like [Oryza brachyantha]|uniref:protein LIM1-like n=1 Tax=Oryza brachyantha TaxID=4533 RepID=UPI001ADD47EE|nr:protein LIM1-like [Oryza brachyantha]